MTITLQVEPRQVFGKKVKNLRKAGLTPAEVYGQGTENISIQVGTRALQKALNQAGKTNVISVEVEGNKSVPVMARNIQYDSISQNVIHVDFHAVDMSSTVVVSVPVEITGKSDLITNQGGTLTTGINTLDIEALPGKIPNSIRIDIGQLTSFSESLLVSHLELGDDIIIHSSPNSMLVSIQPPRLLQEEGSREEEGLSAIGEEIEE